MKPLRKALPWCLCLAAVMPIGCARRVEQKPVFPVSGTVLFEGRPVPHASITFVFQNPSEADTERPTAVAGRDGKFALTTYGKKDGAPAGNYVVLVEARRQIATNGDSDFGDNYLPAKYSQASTSDLKVTISEGNNELALKLNR